MARNDLTRDASQVSGHEQIQLSGGIDGIDGIRVGGFTLRAFLQSMLQKAVVYGAGIHPPTLGNNTLLVRSSWHCAGALAAGYRSPDSEESKEL